MIVFRAVLLLIGALAVLTLGALSGPAAAEVTPPCHETSHNERAPSQAPAPDTPVKPMGCCVACVATVAPEPPLRSAVVLPSPVRTAAPVLMPRGETLSPEPHPPRPILA